MGFYCLCNHILWWNNKLPNICFLIRRYLFVVPEWLVLLRDSETSMGTQNLTLLFIFGFGFLYCLPCGHPNRLPSKQSLHPWPSCQPDPRLWWGPWPRPCGHPSMVHLHLHQDAYLGGRSGWGSSYPGLTETIWACGGGLRTAHCVDYLHFQQWSHYSFSHLNVMTEAFKVKASSFSSMFASLNFLYSQSSSIWFFLMVFNSSARKWSTCN